MSAREPVRLGSWNMGVQRDQGAAAQAGIRMLLDYKLDGLALQECSRYLDDLRRQLPDGVGLEYSVDAPGMSNTAWLYRKSAKVDLGGQWQLTTAGWVTVRGGRTPPKYGTQIRFGGWLRAVSGHRPPSVRWVRRRMIGPVRRVRAMREHAINEVRVVRRIRGAGDAVAILEDWNATPSQRGPCSPRWVADAVGGRLAPPPHPTHGRRTIDYALVVGARAGSPARAGRRGGSDHALYVVTVYPPE